MVDVIGLLGQLGPERIARLDFEVEVAYKEFPIDSSLIETYPEFEELLGRFHQQLERAVHDCDIVHDKEDSEAFAMGIVEHAFGGGRVEAYGRASAGVDGGLPGVLRALADNFKADLLKKWVSESLRRTIDTENWEEREQLAAAYLETFGHVLPREVATTSPMMLATRLEETLKAHVQAQGLIHKLPGQK